MGWDITFKFSIVDDEGNNIPVPFDFSYRHTKNTTEVETYDVLFSSKYSNNFKVTLNFPEDENLRDDEEVYFEVEPHSEIYKKDYFTVDGSELYWTHRDYGYEHNFEAVKNDLKLEVYTDKFRKSDILYSEYERKFGNDDVLIIWHDGKTMNLKYVEDINVEYESNVTDKRIDKSRMGDSSYISKELTSVSLDLILGDVWKKENGDKYKKQNRNSALRTLHELYDNNIIINFRSDIIKMDFATIESYEVQQSGESDNTYIFSCSIKEIDLMRKLPKTMIKKSTWPGHNYEEVPADSPYPLTLTSVQEDEEEEDDSLTFKESFLKTLKDCLPTTAEEAKEGSAY